MKPQVIFDMPEEEYHAIDAISGSGMKQFLKHPMAYWRMKHDPEYVQPEPTAAMKLGTAYHKRFCEGNDAYFASYAVKPDMPANKVLDGKPVLDTATDIKVWLERNGFAFKKSDKKDNLAALVPPDKAIVWDRYILDWDIKAGKKTIISAEDDKEIKRAARFLERIPSFKAIFEGGHSEASIFWNDTATGQLCKARIDFLKPGWIIEFKTFSNPQGKDIETAVVHDIGYNRYGISAVHYWNGITTLLKDGCADIEKLMPNGAQFGFVFVQTGNYPAYLPREYAPLFNGKKNAYWKQSERNILYALSEIKKFEEQFGKEPWLEEQFNKALDDVDFPIWMIEGGE